MVFKLIQRLRGKPDAALLQQARDKQAQYDKAVAGYETILGKASQSGPTRLTELGDHVGQRMAEKNRLADLLEKDPKAYDAHFEKSHPHEGKGFNGISGMDMGQIYPYREAIKEEFGTMLEAAEEITPGNLASHRTGTRMEFEACLGSQRGSDVFYKFRALTESRPSLEESVAMGIDPTEYRKAIDEDFQYIKMYQAYQRGSQNTGNARFKSALDDLKRMHDENKQKLADELGLDVGKEAHARLLDKYADAGEMLKFHLAAPERSAHILEFTDQHKGMIKEATRHLDVCSPDEGRSLYDAVKQRMGQSFEKDAPTPERDGPDLGDDGDRAR